MNTNAYEIINYTINICAALPFAMQIFAYIICDGYKKDARDIHNSKREIFRSIKLRYTNSAKLGIPLEDARSYVVKYLYGQGGPFRFPAILEKMSSFIYCLALMATAALFLRGSSDINRMIAVLAASFCFFIFRTAFSIHRPMELTVEFSVDYLENTLKHRLSPENAKTREKTAEIKSVTPKSATSKSDNTVTTMPEKKPKQSVTENSSTPVVRLPLGGENSDIIEAVLQEFLA